MQLGIIFDSTQFIEESVHEIELELFLAVLLTALVCWLFLGSLSSTLNVVLAIPMSLLGTVAAIYFLGFTLNTFTLLGLSLAVGIVVDDAIMVLENIYRHGEMGKDRVAAAREGTAEITFAALAATLAVIGDLPPRHLHAGRRSGSSSSSSASRSASRSCSRTSRRSRSRPRGCRQLLSTDREHRSRFGRAMDRGFDALAARYARVLRLGLRRPITVLAVAFILFLASLWIFASCRWSSSPRRIRAG